MKKIILLFVVIVSLSNFSKGQWQQISGLDGVYINSFIISGNNMIAAGYPGLFISTDNGLTWSQLTDTLPAFLIGQDLLGYGNKVFAATEQGVFSSPNNGANWSYTSEGLTCHIITKLAIIDSTIFAGTDGGGVYVTTNFGANWNQAVTGLYDSSVTSLVVSGNNIFAGTNQYISGSVFLSTNHGQVWEAKNSGLPSVPINCLAIFGSTIFAGTFGDGVYKSTNNGDNWSAANNGLPQYLNIESITVDSSTIFLTGDGIVYFSTDNGLNWIAASEGLPSCGINAIAVNEENVFAGTAGSGIWRRPLSELTKIDLKSNDNKINIYPNPTHSILNLTINNENAVTIQIYNISGEVVIKKTITNKLDISDLRSGIYTLQISDKKGNIILTKKIIIQ